MKLTSYLFLFAALTPACVHLFITQLRSEIKSYNSGLTQFTFDGIAGGYIPQRPDDRPVFFNERRLDPAVLAGGYQFALSKTAGNGQSRAVIFLSLKLF
jgi:hypothetical protein